MKNSLNQKIGAAVMAAMVVFAACNKSPYPGYEASESGLYYKFYNTKDANAVTAKTGDFVVVRMLYKTNKDSILFNSKNVSRDGSGVLEFPLGPASFKGSFEDALNMMSPGDSASFLVNADSLFLKTFRAPKLPPFVESGTMLTFEVKLEKIKSKEEMQKEQQEKAEQQKVMNELRKSEEPKSIAKYIEENKITAKPTASGLYYIEKVKGKGKKVMTGDTVMVNYKGMFLDGKIFDSSEKAGKPVEFPIGQGRVIKGWDEGIPMMNIGGKAQFIIPSSIAYGEMGAQNVIPPYSPLLFEVEVVGVKGKK